MNQYKEFSVTGKLIDWEEAGKMAAEDPIFFKNFRSTEEFIQIVEGTPKLAGEIYINKLLKNQRFKLSVPKVVGSELHGNPKNMILFNLDGSRYSISTTTLRYANNAVNIQYFFPNLISSGSIIEIGAGYGGECKVFNDFNSQSDTSNSSLDWVIYDLLTSEGLIKKWLQLFEYSAKFASIESPIAIKENTLVLSNGALSEMHGKLLEKYFNEIVLKCKYGYFMVNFDEHSAPVGGWTNKYFVEKLISGGKKDAILFKGNKFLDMTDTATSLVVFGHGGNLPKKNGFVENFLIPFIFSLKSKIIHA